jgi:hypothetical protein
VLPWSGQPAQPPSLAVVAAAGGHSGATAYASWNGATEVASWRLLAGASAGALAPVSTAPKHGFETTIALPGTSAGAYVAAQAVNAAGAVIGTSATVKVSASP